MLCDYVIEQLVFVSNLPYTTLLDKVAYSHACHFTKLVHFFHSACFLLV